MKISITFFIPLFIVNLGFAKNPIIPNKGANDPHIRIIDGMAYLSASHDRSANDKTFVMEDWWLWSSDDLVNWELEYTLKPEETYIGKPFTGCWATDIVKRNNKFYWYFSERNHQAGVMVGESPAGPWVDPLGKPLLSEDMTATHEYDIGIVNDQEGNYYIVFGVWDYYIAKLNEDMISLAEEPHKIMINNPLGPYNSDGKNTEKPTDDKPFIHFYNGNYYLSWGCFYAMSDNLYGPYDCKGSIIEQESFAPGYDSPTWPNGFKQGRHGSFFQWHNQWYFAYCDISQTGNRYFRDTFISYVHYKANGEMALIHVDGIGVGEYDSNQIIQAENFTKSSNVNKVELKDENGFKVSATNNNEYLIFNNIHHLDNKTKIEIKANGQKGSSIEVRSNNVSGELLGVVNLKKNNQTITVAIPQLEATENICFAFKNGKKGIIDFDSFTFK